MRATYFNDIIQIGLNTLMPTKSVKLHSNDAPWMTGHLKLLIYTSTTKGFERKEYSPFSFIQK